MFEMIETVTNRRSFLRGMVSLIAAPAIVRVTSLMPISVPRSGYMRQYSDEPFIKEILELLSKGNEIMDDMQMMQSDLFIYGTGALDVRLPGITHIPLNAIRMPASPRQDPCQALPKFRHNPMPNFLGRPIKGDDI